MSEKRRIDQLLVERGLAQSRQRAQSALMAGLVYVSGQRVDKAGALVAADAEIELRGEACPYVSRGGLKLARAVEAFGLDLRGRVCLDVGASTGGFTDCMLQQGAKKVYCVDVGYGQLAWSLRSDPRVVNLERTNVRGLTEYEVGEPIDFASIDVSFISLKLVLPVVQRFLRPGAELVALVKPQFEAGRAEVGKNGVVRDASVHASVLREVAGFCAEIGLPPSGLTWSPIKGPKGNIEFLLWLCGRAEEICIDKVVEQAHAALRGGDQNE